MNWKRFLFASLVVFVAVQAMEFVISNVFMRTATESLKALWRPNMSSKMWAMYLAGALVSLMFVYIFAKGREGKGVAEGVRYGIVIWLFFNVPMNVSMWVMLPISYTIIIQWILFGLLEMLIAGILVALIYKPLAPAKA